MQFIILIFVVLLAGCGTYKTKDPTQKDAVRLYLQKENERLNSEHLVCFVCETHSIPTSIEQLNEFIPKAQECKKKFKVEKFYYPIKRYSSYKISAQDTYSSLVFTVSKSGKTFDELQKEGEGYLQTFNILKKSFPCKI